MRVALLGLGLVGGSIARALRVDPAWSVVAWTPAGEGPRAALADGTIEEAATSPEAAVRDAGVVVLAAPPLACLELLAMLAGPIRDVLGEALVTDVASTKSAIVGRAEALGIRFVGGHPMAGRETSGFGAADAGLFHDRPWIVVPGATARDGDAARIESLATACGARPLTMEADAHDEAVAAISHLPLVAAAALVEAVAGTDTRPRDGWREAAPLAAAGWQGMTRLARGDPAMGAGIAATNAGPLAARLRAFRDAIDDWLAELDRPEGPDPGRLEARLAAARRRLEADP